MPYELPPLPYATNALEPSIDAQTMEIHHDKHHKAYVDKLNAAIAGKADLEAKSLDALLANLDAVPDDIRAAVRNNGGGHWNHSFFWELLTPGGSSTPTGELAKAIDAAFGSFDAFKEKFEAAGVGRFGSGWVWLISKGSTVSIVSTPNQDAPVMEGSKAIVGVDVWEHAYYLKYQNKRPDYLKAIWNVINWDVAGKHFAS